ncbi:MAG: SurA N-terminal domain-containing protein [Rikenellaceae bacterium]
MATLNTLRTRFGVVLSAVIAFALLAFIFSLKSEMGFSGNDPIVAQINGQDVTMSEYSNEYYKVQRQLGTTEVGEEQANMLYSATWQSLITEYALRPGMSEMGLTVGDKERMSIISGEIPTQAMYNAFVDPSTGVYNVNAVNNFLLTSQNNPESEQVWAMLSEQSMIERQGNKYMALVSAGINLNSLEIENGVNGANKSYQGRWVRKNYADISDSLATVSAAEIKDYYNSNISAYKRQPSRSISYVSFNIAPSASDLATLKSEANEVGEQFRSATDIRAFIRENRDGSIANNYVTESMLPSLEAEALVSGEMYGPVSSDSSWRLSRVYESIDAPDTLYIRHIVLPYTSQELADSLLVALRQGGDFALAALTHSIYTQTAQLGGEIGAIPFSGFVDEFAATLAPAKKGDIVQIASGDMIQLMQVYDAGKRTKHYKVASIEIPILPSDATRRAAHNAAGVFAVAAKGNYDKFVAAATDSEVSPRSADINSSSRNITSIDGSSEIARWAHRAKVGDLSEIFKVSDGYVVAMLTNVDDSEHMPLKSVEGGIKRTLMNKKKFEMMSSKLSGSTFDDISANMDGEVGEFTGVNFESYYASGMGVEPKVVGAITSTESIGSVSRPIQGNAGIYLFEVSEITKPEVLQTAEAERVRAESMQQRMVQQMLFGSLEGLANIKDMRGANL